MIARPPKLWHRYVAIGDSFTEGMSDADPRQTDAYLGWADRLAAHLDAEVTNAEVSNAEVSNAEAGPAEFGYANLAIRGRLLADITGRQTDAAIGLRPDLVSIVGGGNDIMRPRADIDALAEQLDGAVARIRATGSDVLMATPPDPKEAPLVRHTRGRLGLYIAHIWSIARRHDAFVLDQWGLAPLKDWRMWSEDRIHMTSEGHRRVALAAFTTLGFATTDATWSAPLPPAAPISRPDAARANAQWAREHVGPWVQRRLRGESSGDRLEAKRPTMAPLER